MNKYSTPNISGKKILSNDGNINNSTFNNKLMSTNNNDKTVKVDSAHNKENKIKKYNKAILKFNKYYFYSNKYFLIIIFLFYIFDDNRTNQIDLNNYLDKIYGEEDLLKIIKEKERKKANFSKKKRYKIEKEIENIYDVIKKIKKKKKEIINKNKKIVRYDGKLILACSYALDNRYTFPTLVAMTSLVINAGKNTFYNIYVLTNPDFTEKNKKILKSVENSYSDHCKIFIINMGNKFQGLNTYRFTASTYYKLDLHNILSDVDRIIYMDGDTAVFQDLSDLIFLDMKGNYILGYLDSNENALKKYKIKNPVILCAGVILMDLSALRKNNITEKFNLFFKENNGKIEQHDQTTINVVCQGKISTLPPKYGIWNSRSFRDVIDTNYDYNPSIRYNKKELLLAYKHPAILHYIIGKPYIKLVSKCYYKEWWEYAKKTVYYHA